MVYKIHRYTQAGGRSDVQETYDSGSAERRAELDVALEYLKCRDRGEWRRPKAAKLSKTQGYRDYFEIRFMADQVQQRPIGYFGPESGVFTILLWATEKGGTLRPADWYDKAERRRARIESGTDQSIPLQQHGENADAE